MRVYCYVILRETSLISISKKFLVVMTCNDGKGNVSYIERK